jgi:hypothetical protein
MQLELFSPCCEKTHKKHKYKSHLTYWNNPTWCENCFIAESIKILKSLSSFLRRRRSKHPSAKIRKNLRNRIRRMLHNALNNSPRNIKKTALVGCNRLELKAHIEKQFKPGMSWDNYGEWHVDHIKPCVLFDITKKEDLVAMNHYTNLQPLWAKDNLSKGAKYVTII